jgi:hypothetical protein
MYSSRRSGRVMGSSFLQYVIQLSATGILIAFEAQTSTGKDSLSTHIGRYDFV